MEFIGVADVPGLTAADQWMIDDVVAQARNAAPCLKFLDLEADADEVAFVRSVLRGALMRLQEAGSGALQQHTQTALGFSESQTFDTRQQRRRLLWPSEISDLQRFCAGRTDTPVMGSAFTVGMGSGGVVLHGLWCNLRVVGPASYCSCGADIAGEPIFGVSS